MLIADGTGAVRFANAAAEALLKNKMGLSVRNGRLVHTLPRSQAALSTLLRDAAAGKGGGMRLPRGGERPDLHLLLAAAKKRGYLAALVGGEEAPIYGDVFGWKAPERKGRRAALSVW